MKVYLAAPHPARSYVLGTGYAKLEAAGHECTSTWAQSTEDISSSLAADLEDASHRATRDLAAIAESDVLIQLTAEFCRQEAGCTEDQNLHSGGRHVELGYALARDICVIVVGPEENVFQRGLCLTAETLAEAIELLWMTSPVTR